MVGHDVHDHPHAALVQGGGERLQGLPAADLGVDARVVEHVIPVLGAGDRGEHRGEVGVAHPQGVQVGHHLQRVGAGEPGVQLQAVGGGQLAVGVVRHGGTSVSPHAVGTEG